MGISLSERIAAKAHSAKKINQHGAKNLALVLAMREDIEKASDDGWSIKAIWETLSEEKKFPGNYQAFRRAWLRIIESKEHKQVRGAEAPLSTGTKDVPASAVKKEPLAGSTGIKSFSFDNVKK